METLYSNIKISIKKSTVETFQAIQDLRLRLPMQGVWVWSLVWELRSHMPWGQKNQNRSNTVTNSIKTKNGPQQKKILKKYTVEVKDVWLGETLVNYKSL